MDRDERRATWLGRWMLAAVIPCSALFIGSLLVPVLVVMTACAATASALLWFYPPPRATRATRWALAAFGIVVGVTLFQSLPMPASLVAFIAPANADTWARALTPLRETGPSWHPLSVAPIATRIELVRGAFYVCVFLGALRVTFAARGAQFLEAVVLVSVGVLAISTLGHAAVHAESVFGIYSPRESNGYVAGRIGPLLNPNHVAAYCNIGTFVAAGAALRDRRWMMRVVAASAATLCAGTSVWAGSRAGTGSLVFGVATFAVLALVVRRRKNGMSLVRVELAALAGALVVAGAFLGFSSSEVAQVDLAGRDVAKFEIVRQALRLVPLSPVGGIGRGAFETMFPLVREGTSYFTFVRAENIVAQWAIEWGVPTAVVGFVAFAQAMRPRVLFGAERPPIGPWVAILVAVLHDLVDFHLEVPAVAALATVCFAMVVGTRPSMEARSSSQERSTRKRTRIIAFAAASGAIVAGLSALPAIGHTLSEDRDAIARMAMDRSVGEGAFRSAIRAAMLRYPAEPFLPLAGAVRAQYSHDEKDVILWSGRALERYPGFGRAHLVLARTFAPKHRAQSRLEYRLAYTHDTNLRSTVLREAPYVVDDKSSALEVVPEGAAGIEMLDAFAAVLADRLPATALGLDEELLARDPRATGPLRRRIYAAMSDLTQEHVWCSDRSACTVDAIAAAEALVAREPDKCESHVLLARLHVLAGRTVVGLDGLTGAIRTVADRSACLRQLVQMCMETGEKRRADAALEMALGSGCGAREECLDLYVWAGRTEQARGNYVRAISFYKRAADLAPETDDHLLKVGELAERAGLNAEAVDVYSKLALRHPDDPQWKRRADTTRAKAMDRRLPQ